MGGTVRDLLLGREPHDIDLVTAGDPEPLARRFADAIGGAFFTMSEEFMTCRAISADGRLNYDFAARRGRHIIEDLGDRDFTVNAMAVELPGGGVKPGDAGGGIEPGGGVSPSDVISPGDGVFRDGGLIDPFGGAAHLAGRELVPVEESIFDRDPLRLLRAVRLEKTHGLVIGPALARLIKSRAVLASKPSVERIFFELSRILEVPGGSAGVRRLDELELLEVLLPELTALKGVIQNEFHHLDVYGHVLAAVDELDRLIAEPETLFPGHGEKITARVDRRIAGDAGCRLVLSLAAFFHDIAKPNCRFTDKDGLVRFFEHDRLSAELTGAILARFKANAEATRAVTLLVRRHMRFEALTQEDVPSDRARLRYLRATEPFSPEAILLSVADRMAVRGIRVTAADIEHHLEVARGMLDLAFAAAEAVPLPRLVDGDDLMRELGLEPGPLVGRLLNHIREEQQLGNITTRGQALAAALELAKSAHESDAEAPRDQRTEGKSVE